jgi:hypothetical protein
MPEGVVPERNTITSGLEPMCAVSANTTRARPPYKNAVSHFFVDKQAWRCLSLYESARICKCTKTNRTAPEADASNERELHGANTTTPDVNTSSSSLTREQLQHLVQDLAPGSTAVFTREQLQHLVQDLAPDTVGGPSAAVQ